VLNNDMSEIWDNELLINVTRLNIDSASFHQIKKKLESQGHTDMEKAFAEHTIDLVNRTVNIRMRILVQVECLLEPLLK